ncbi:MAG: sugar phosphate isomerase/epimerase [Planctomycetaceae bacterium]|nr:sugar phosphate isomerase/epimerase [Planctomycetaceae bacterium]
MTQPTISRRAALAGFATTALGTSTLGAAQEANAKIGLGFSLYGLPKWSLSDGIKLCAATGYDSVELVLMSTYPSEPKQLSKSARAALRKQLADSKLNVSGLMDNLPVQADEAKHREQLDRIKAAAELAHELAPNAPPPLETIIGGKPGQWDEFKQLATDRIAEWARIAEQAKLVVCVKPHAGGALNRPEDAIALVRQIDSPWLRLVYDYSHYEHRGMSLADTMRELLPFCPFVHVKDRVADTSKLQFLLPGEGSTDYTDYARLLASHGYRGHVVVEVSAQIHGRPDYDPRRAVQRSYDVLAAAWKRAGVGR